MIKKVVDLAEHLTPIALVGAGGIGKTSIALTVLHHDRIRRRFGEDRRFIRCDKFPPSLLHFLRQLSQAIGAGVQNPENLIPLWPFLSSKDMLIVLDNAESILDPRRINAEEIYAVIEELSQLRNVCLCITSRISTVPPDCKWLDVPKLSMEAACDTFYRIYQHGERSDLIKIILEQLDFHALSITLLATVAHQNKWDTDRLVSEWGERRTDMLQTDHKSLATAIELSLSSLMFQELDFDVRDLLGVIAFFPQGVYGKGADGLFPTIAGRKHIFDRFCVLSLTYRSDGFIMMLAPIRDHFSPRDPMLAPLLRLTKEHYFTRLSVDVKPGRPGFEEARWITSEDANVEHLLDVFTTIDATSDGVWDACAGFMEHIYWHKPRLVVLGPKIEALPDDHPFKLKCLYHLSRLFWRSGNQEERKRLVTHALQLSRERGDDHQLTQILMELSDVYLEMCLYGEGKRRVKEALAISERLGDAAKQAECWIILTQLLYYDDQLDAAEEAAFRAIDLLPEQGEQFLASHIHYVLGGIYRSKGDKEKAIHHLEVALGIAYSFNWRDTLSLTHSSLLLLLMGQGRFDDAEAHAIPALRNAVESNDMNLVGHVIGVWNTFSHVCHLSEKPEAPESAKNPSITSSKHRLSCLSLLLNQTGA